MEKKITYNPMSKEFQDECKRLGLTGRELTAKYKKEGRYIEKDDIYFKREDRRGIPRDRNVYTEKELLDILVQSCKDLGRPPGAMDFNNSKYPGFSTYVRRFGSWSNALKLVGLDVESLVKKGVLLTNQQKARLAEIIIRDSFDNPSIDLAGENQNSSCDGICPNGKYYDVKSCKLRGTYYTFDTNNKLRDEIEIYYFLGFNEDWTKLNYGWRIPGEIVEDEQFCVGTCKGWFTIEDMENYNITEELRKVFDKYDFLK